jgi:transcriptional regulator with XRE-family HTH domain
MKPSAILSTGLRLDALGERIRDERKKRDLSLDDLSRRASVSRSMLSAVERGEKTPSVLVLDQIATGLGSSIARLLGEERQDRVILIRRDEQNVASDPDGWQRRVLSPVLPNVEFEFMRTTIGPGVNAGAFLPHNPGSREYVAIEKGTLQLTLDGTPYLLKKGDSIYYAGDCLHEFKNPHAREACEYYLAMDVTGHPDQLQHRTVLRRALKPIKGIPHAVRQ